MQIRGLVAKIFTPEARVQPGQPDGPHDRFQAQDALPSKLDPRDIEPPLQDWGSRSQVMATLRDLADARGNRNGLWGDEGGCDPGNPLFLKIKQALAHDVSKREAVVLLQEFVSQKEQEWGEKISDLPPSRFKKNGKLFLAQKAIALARMDRKPSEVQDGFHVASGNVKGHRIEDRRLFYQHFKPQGEPSGKVVLVSPGFQETGRNFYEQIEEMSRAGHDVVVMDHQWAGQSDGKPGGIDRGFGVARDVAAMAARTHELFPDRELILFGNSMGAGPGVLGALTLAEEEGALQLKGPAMPKGLKAVLQAPFLEASGGLVNPILGVLSRVWPLNLLANYSLGVPVLTKDETAAHKGSQMAVLEDVRARLQAMTASNKDLGYIRESIDSGHGPSGRIAVVHGDRDPLANPDASRWLQRKMGDQVDLLVVSSPNHVLEQSPNEQHFALELLRKLVSR